MSKASKYKKVDVSTITSNLEFYEGVTKNTSAKLEFAKKHLEGKPLEDQQNILYSIIKDLGPKADKHPVVDALKIYMAQEGVALEDINNIGKVAEKELQQGSAPEPEAPKQTPAPALEQEPLKSEILDSSKPKTQPLQKGSSQEAEKIKLSEKIEPTVAVVQGDFEKEAPSKILKGILKPKKQNKASEEFIEKTTLIEGNYSQGFSAPAKDSIVLGPAAGASQEVDAITEAVRKEILLKQQRMLQGEIAAKAESEEEKNRIKKFSNAEFRDYVKGEGKDKAKAALSDERFQKKLNVVETLGYQKIHDKFKDNFKNVEWNEVPPSTRTIQVTNNATISETTHNQSPKTVQLSDGSVKTVKSYRTINFPTDLKDKGPVHLSMAVKDENGQNISEKDAVYFTAHYDKDGKLTEVSSPMPVKFMGNGPEAVGYIERDGKIYTLPVDHATYQGMMLQVEKNGKNVNLAQGPGENIASPAQSQQQGQGAQSAAFSTTQSTGQNTPKLSQSQQSPGPSTPATNDPYLDAITAGKEKNDPAYGMKLISDQLAHIPGGAEKVVSILKDQVKKGNVEVVDAIIKLTKDKSHPQHYDGIPTLNPKQFEEVYSTGMEAAKAIASTPSDKLGNMKAICNTLAPVAKVDPLAHNKAIAELQGTGQQSAVTPPPPMLSQTQSPSSPKPPESPKPAEVSSVVSPSSNEPKPMWHHAMDVTLKGKTEKEIVGIFKKEIEKGNVEVVERMVKALDPDGKHYNKDLPVLTKDHYIEAYRYGMIEASPNAKDRNVQNKMHMACSKLGKIAGISDQYHITKSQTNSKAPLKSQQKGVMPS